MQREEMEIVLLLYILWKKAEAEAFVEQSANCTILHVIKAAEQLSSVKYHYETRNAVNRRL